MMDNPLLSYLNQYDQNGSSSTSSSSSPSPQPLPQPTPTPPPPPPTDSLKGKLQLSPSDELPQIHHDLVPLSHVLSRVVGQAYADLRDLAETLPAADDAAKKRAVVDYVLQTRRQLLKLLVLVRWSRDAIGVRKCMNLIGFLTHQNGLLDNSLSSLLNVSSSLASARVRNYDLPTAISVLTTGSYRGLPRSIESRFSSSASGGEAGKMGDEQVLQTMEDVNEVMRWRLGGGGEKLPGKGMNTWRIEDGRVFFKVEGLWEASFTYSGSGVEGEDDGEWYLLGISFLFRVGDSKGSWTSTPKGAMKDHLIELCNRILARRRTSEAVNSNDDRSKEKDHPLIRAYAFLQNLALQYQIEALHSQALALQRSLWAGSLRVELITTSINTSKGRNIKQWERQKTELKIEYWTPPPLPKTSRAPSASAPGGSIPPPLQQQPGGALIISFFSTISSSAPASTSKPSANMTSAATKSKLLEKEKDKDVENTATDGAREAVRARLKSLERALNFDKPFIGLRGEEGETEGHNDESDAEEHDVQRRLSVGWGSDGLDQSVREEALEGDALQLNSDLDLETLLLRATSVHARESIRQLYERLVADLGPDDVELIPSADDLTSLSSNTVPTLRIHLFGQHWLIASISPRSGKLELSAIGEVGAMREARLRNAAEKVDKDRRVAGETLLRVRASTIVDEVDSRACFLGLRTVRRLALRQHDWSKFGPSNRSFLFVHLTGLPAHYLVLVLHAEGFRFALISVKEMADGIQSWLAIEELGWLDKTPSHEGTDVWDTAPAPDSSLSFGFDVSIDDLRDLHLYCVRRIAYFKIEQQLHVRCIPFKSVASFTPSPRPVGSPATRNTSPTSPASPTSPSLSGPRMLSSASPYLVIQSSDLLRSAARVAYPNIAIQCFLVDGVVRTTLHVRFRELGIVNADSSELPSSVTFDPKTSVVTFTSHDINNCVPAFLTAYSIVARSIILALHRSSQLSKRPRVDDTGRQES